MVLVADEVGKGGSWSAKAGVVTARSAPFNVIYKMRWCRGIFYVFARHNQPSRSL
jgi:hypothetical protein